MAGRKVDYDQLTPTEIRVLHLIAQGLRAEEAAQAMHLGTETVKSHMRSVRWKFGVHTAAGAVAIGFRRGLLS